MTTPDQESTMAPGTRVTINHILPSLDGRPGTVTHADATHVIVDLGVFGMTDLVLRVADVTA